MVRRMTADLPAEFTDGIVDVVVTRKTIPHPVREGVYTLGECVPHAFGTPGEDDAGLRSAIELHYGSFAALAREHPDFDWREEAFETLTHEVRHHLEWRARVPELERLDDAAEANYARQDGEPFPPLFYRDGERVAEGVYRVEDDVFIELVLEPKAWAAAAEGPLAFAWHGRPYTVALPAELPEILYVTVDGVTPAPPGDVVVVLRRKPGARDVLRRPTVGRHEAPGRWCPRRVVIAGGADGPG
jgi:hypothetical protein